MYIYIKLKMIKDMYAELYRLCIHYIHTVHISTQYMCRSPSCTFPVLPTVSSSSTARALPPILALPMLSVTLPSTPTSQQWWLSAWDGMGGLSGAVIVKIGSYMI